MSPQSVTCTPVGAMSTLRTTGGAFCRSLSIWLGTRSPKVRLRVTAMVALRAVNEAMEKDTATMPARLELAINVAV